MIGANVEVSFSAPLSDPIKPTLTRHHEDPHKSSKTENLSHYCASVLRPRPHHDSTQNTHINNIIPAAADRFPPFHGPRFMFPSSNTCSFTLKRSHFCDLCVSPRSKSPLLKQSRSKQPYCRGNAGCPPSFPLFVVTVSASTLLGGCGAALL